MRQATHCKAFLCMESSCMSTGDPLRSTTVWTLHTGSVGLCLILCLLSSALDELVNGGLSSRTAVLVCVSDSR